MIGALDGLERRAGVLRIDPEVTVERVRARVGPLGLRVFYLDGRGLSDKATFLRRAAEAMEFPEGFGDNWDAFYDCLTDLGWCPAPGYVLYVDRSDLMRRADPESWAVARGLFDDAVAHWQTVGIPMAVLLREPADEDVA